MTYEITFDGTQYAMDIRDMDPSRALRIIEILNEAVSKAVADGTIKPTPIRINGRLYGQIAEEISNKDSNKINAIKALRENVRIGLKEAKDLIDYARKDTMIMPALWTMPYESVA